MSVNKYAPHVLVLPEDSANSQIANGFQLALPALNVRKMQILPEAGGWAKVRDRFLSDHLLEMERCSTRYMVLLIDCDNKPGRIAEVKSVMSDGVAERVFVVGALSRPEDLKQSGLGTFEEIGQLLAKDCAEHTSSKWEHRLLRHNAPELERMRMALYPFLFTTTV